MTACTGGPQACPSQHNVGYPVADYDQNFLLHSIRDGFCYVNVKARDLLTVGLLYDYDMAFKPQTTRQLREKRKERFYSLLSERCNYMNTTTVMQFYLSTVAVVLDELRRGKIVTLPLLGDLQLVEQKRRVAWVGKRQAVIGPRDVLKFRATDDLKRYLSAMQGPAVILNQPVYRGKKDL